MKLYIWGTGCGAGDLVDRWFDPAEIEAFIDSQPSGASFLGRRVLRPEEVSADEETLILVASRQTDEIASLATACGIAPERLLFLKNNWQLRDRNAPYPSNTVLPAGLLEELRRPPRKVRDPLWASGGPLSERDLENDTVRVRTLEALCRELDGVPGAAAELGVYRGAFERRRPAPPALPPPTRTRRPGGCSLCCRTRSGRSSDPVCFPARRQAWRTSASASSRLTWIWRRARSPGCAFSCRGSRPGAICCCTTAFLPRFRGCVPPCGAMSRRPAPVCTRFRSAISTEQW